MFPFPLAMVTALGWDVGEEEEDGERSEMQWSERLGGLQYDCGDFSFYSVIQCGPTLVLRGRYVVVCDRNVKEERE